MKSIFLFVLGLFGNASMLPLGRVILFFERAILAAASSEKNSQHALMLSLIWRRLEPQTHI
jgi:hypothetical protein